MLRALTPSIQFAVGVSSIWSMTRTVVPAFGLFEFEA